METILTHLREELFVACRLLERVLAMLSTSWYLAVVETS
jgi:hypothetical protein